MAVYKLYKAQLKIMAAAQQSYTIFFIAIACIAFGSAYYHWQPNNSSLVWDRVPITIAFMSLFSFALAETVSCRLGRMVLFPLLFTGILSVACWYWGEIHGSGDLRLYALVQFLPCYYCCCCCCWANRYLTARPATGICLPPMYWQNWPSILM